MTRPRSNVNVPSEHPVCVKCAGCSGPIEITWTESCGAGTRIYHSDCYHDMLEKKGTHTCEGTHTSRER